MRVVFCCLFFFSSRRRHTRCALVDWSSDVGSSDLALEGVPGETSTVKEVDHITPEYRAWIEAAPFVARATAGPEGLDCSPRGDAGSVVRVQDARTVLLPDRRGNNRTDSLRNIVRDPRVGLLFLIPGAGTTLPINGRARPDTGEIGRASCRDRVCQYV